MDTADHHAAPRLSPQVTGTGRIVAPDRVLHKHGHAPTSHWLFWHPKAWKLGRYNTIYKTCNNGVPYRNKYVTKSVRC
jgi:hypothetical protein